MSAALQATWLFAAACSLTACTTLPSPSASEGSRNEALYRSANHVTRIQCEYLGNSDSAPVETFCGALEESGLPGFEISFGDCSNSEFACVRSPWAMFATPRAGVRADQSYEHHGVLFRVEDCSAPLEGESCDAAVISGACVDPSKCALKSEAPIVAYFWFQPARGITAFTYWDERIPLTKPAVALGYLGELRVLVREKGFLSAAVRLEPYAR